MTDVYLYQRSLLRYNINPFTLGTLAGDSPAPLEVATTPISVNVVHVIGEIM